MLVLFDFLSTAALLNRMPQKRNDESAIFYGSYIGASLSIGFLFLSGGAKTFGTSKESGMVITSINFFVFLHPRIFLPCSRVSSDVDLSHPDSVNHR